MLLGFREIATFDVHHGALPWPWIAFDATRTRFGYPSAAREITVRGLDDDARGTYALPLSLPSGDTPGLHAFAVGDGVVAATGVADGRSIVTIASDRAVTADVATLVGDGHAGRALRFDRAGRLWLATEGESGGRLTLLDASLSPIGAIELPQYPPPVLFELALHPSEDAVLLLASCGEDGTFVRVARYDDGVHDVPTTIEHDPAGFVGFSADGQRVFLVEDERLRAHRWPDLLIEVTADLPDDVVSNYSGIVDADVVLVDAADTESEDDVVLAFDARTLKPKPPPTAIRDAMWAGRLEARALVTVRAKGEPARGTLWRFLP